jgi:hypothetical protein
MSISISSTVFPPVAESAVTAAPRAPRTASSAVDTVNLTAAQQVYELYNQGQTVPQIALSLNLGVPQVNSFLGISNSAS